MALVLQVTDKSQITHSAQAYLLGLIQVRSGLWKSHPYPVFPENSLIMQ